MKNRFKERRIEELEDRIDQLKQCLDAVPIFMSHLTKLSKSIMKN